MGSERFAQRALLHPASWIALFVLALNDHVLKGAGLFPGWLSGKLSDFAGLFVAPIVLAVLVRARGRASVLACYALVGCVFAALEVQAVAASVSRMLGIALWADASDLLALSVLWPSWRFVWRAPEPAAHARFVWPVATLALVLGAATSPAYERYVRKPGARLRATAVLRNASKTAAPIRVSSYEPERCAVLLRGDASAREGLEHDESVFWWLEPNENIPLFEELDVDLAAPCAIIEVDGAMFVIARNAIPLRDVPHYGAVDSGAVILDGSLAEPDLLRALPPIVEIER